MQLQVNCTELREQASNFDNETKKIENNYKDAGYPNHVIKNTIKNVNRKKKMNF